MSQSLIKERQSRILGLSAAGPIFSIYGSDGDADAGKKEDKTTDGGQADGDKADEGEPPEEATTATVSKAEYDALVARMKQSDTRRTKAESELQKIADAQKSELELAQSKLAEAEARAEKAEERARVATVQTAILKTPGYSWHEPDTVLRLIDMESITFDDAGEPTGVKEAVKTLASKSAYLLKSSDDGGKGKGKQQSNGDGTGTPPGGPATGHQPAGQQPDKGAAQREDLMKRYPQLR